MKLGDMEQAIRNVDGVTDVVFQEVVARADGMTFDQGTLLVLANAVISRVWPTVSGYIVSETSSDLTLVDSLTFIPE